MKFFIRSPRSLPACFIVDGASMRFTVSPKRLRISSISVADDCRDYATLGVSDNAVIGAI